MRAFTFRDMSEMQSRLNDRSMSTGAAKGLDTPDKATCENAGRC